MRWVLALALIFAALAAPAKAQAPTCAKGDFEAVVDDAAAALRDLNAKNKPEFQERLRQLKDKRAWTNDQFLKEAAPLVQDPTITGYDAKTTELLNAISTMGQEGSEAKTPDCALLADLRGRMQALVEAQTAKWTYMFGKVDGELAK